VEILPVAQNPQVSPNGVSQGGSAPSQPDGGKPDPGALLGPHDVSPNGVIKALLADPGSANPPRPDGGTQPDGGPPDGGPPDNGPVLTPDDVWPNGFLKALFPDFGSTDATDGLGSDDADHLYHHHGFDLLV